MEMQPGLVRLAECLKRIDITFSMVAGDGFVLEKPREQGALALRFSDRQIFDMLRQGTDVALQLLLDRVYDAECAGGTEQAPR